MTTCAEEDLRDAFFFENAHMLPPQHRKRSPSLWDAAEEEDEEHYQMMVEM